LSVDTAELYEICLVRARDKLKILQDASSSSDTDSISSFTGFALVLFEHTTSLLLVQLIVVVIVTHGCSGNQSGSGS